MFLFSKYQQLPGGPTSFSCLSFVSCSWSLPCKMHDTCSLFYPLDPDKYRLMRVNCTDSLRCMRLTNSFNSLRLHGQQEMEYKHRRVLKVSAVKHWTNTLLCFTDGIACVGVCASLSLCACIYKSFCECLWECVFLTCPPGHTSHSKGPSVPRMIGSPSVWGTSALAPWWSGALKHKIWSKTAPEGRHSAK